MKKIYLTLEVEDDIAPSLLEMLQKIVVPEVVYYDLEYKKVEE